MSNETIELLNLISLAKSEAFEKSENKESQQLLAERMDMLIGELKATPQGRYFTNEEAAVILTEWKEDLIARLALVEAIDGLAELVGELSSDRNERDND